MYSENPIFDCVFMCTGLWSVTFIEVWKRREAEHRFLWGTDHLAKLEKPRLKFIGQSLINSETGLLTLVHKSTAVYYTKQTIAVVIVIIFIVFTIVCALGAQMIRYVPVNEATSMFGKNKFKLLSSVLNLAIIGVFGQLFESIASALTRWENHRTQSDVDNAIIAKNFVFQFINNYFVLFYIAYLREVSFAALQPHPCDGGNCFPQLQMQLAIVFTGKTI